MYQRKGRRSNKGQSQDWTRPVQLRVQLRACEVADLEAIAQGWGCAVATAAWAIVSGELAKYRHQASKLGDSDTLPVLAALGAGVPLKALKLAIEARERELGRAGLESSGGP